MNTIQQNIQAIQEAYEKVRSHPMCRALHDDGVYIRVIYPADYWPEGVQCSYGITYGKAEALARIYTAMEKHWQENVVK